MNNTNPEPKSSRSESDKDARILRQGRKLFIREFDKQLKELGTLLDAVRAVPVVEDLNRFYRIIHTLKGSAPILDMTGLADLQRIWCAYGNGRKTLIRSRSCLLHRRIQFKKTQSKASDSFEI